jgi:hypothetical protein
MNQEAQEKLNNITAKELHALTEDEISFLKARRDCLDETLKVKFAGILGEPAKIMVEQPKEPKAKKPKAKKDK